MFVIYILRKLGGLLGKVILRDLKESKLLLFTIKVGDGQF